jgi:hypothetical protein
MNGLTGCRMAWLAAWLASAGLVACAEAGLMPGDIAIIGMNTDNPDEFAWTPLVDVDPGQEIFFSDAGWINGQFSGLLGGSGDGAVKFTAPASGVGAGEIRSVILTALPADYAAANDARVGPGMSLSTSGDQLVAFTGSSAAPTFLFGLNLRSAQWGAPSNPSPSLDTDVYAGLTDGLNAVSVGVGPKPGDEFDNARYVGPTSGTRDELLAAIANDGNWQGTFASGNDRFSDLANGAAHFDVQSAAAPEPTSLALSALGALALGAYGWRRRAARRRSGAAICGGSGPQAEPSFV